MATVDLRTSPVPTVFDPETTYQIAADTYLNFSRPAKLWRLSRHEPTRESQGFENPRDALYIFERGRIEWV